MLPPSVPYGVSTLAIGWPGTVSLSMADLASHGFRRFVLANYQADPDHLRAMAATRRERRRRLLRLARSGARTGRAAMALRGELIARRLVRALGSPSRS